MFFPPTLNPAPSFRGSISGKRRNFTTLTPALSQYLSIPAVTATGDFEIEIEFTTTNSASTIYLVDADADLVFKIGRYSDGFMHYLVGNGSGWDINMTGVNNVHDGKLHIVNFSRVGNVCTARVDGNIDVASGNPTISPASLFQIGRRFNGSDHFDGIIANVNFKSGWTQVGNPTGNPYYKVNEDWADNDILINHAVSLGAEEVTNGTFDTDTTGWTAYNGASLASVGGELEITSDGTLSPFARQLMATVAGNVYKLSGRLRTEAGQVKLQAQDNASFASIALYSTTSLVDVVAEVIFTAQSTTTRINLAYDGTPSIGDKFFFDDISIRKAPGYGTAVNITNTDAELFTEHKEFTPDEWWNMMAPNMLEYSNDFANSWWSKTRMTVDGEGLIPSVELNSHALYDSDKLDFEKEVYYTSSSIMKKGAFSKVLMKISTWDAAWASQGSAALEIDLDVGVIHSESGTFLISSSIINAADGYYKVALTWKIAAAADVIKRRGLELRPLDSLWSSTLAGDGVTPALYLKSAQVEKGSVATTHKITTDNPSQRIEIVGDIE